MMIFFRRERPEHQRAYHQPKQPRAEYRAERALAQAPFPGERRRDIADGGGVEAIEKQHRRAGQQQPDLKPADRLCVDKRGDIDRRCTCFSSCNRHSFFPLALPSLRAKRTIYDSAKMDCFVAALLAMTTLTS
jgi:hypothetical protein